MISIRKGNRKDLPKIFDLIKELAVYENAPEQVTNTIPRMEVELFEEHNNFGILVAEEYNEVIGISIFYYRYSTWKGKRLYLEDLVVTESRRGLGAGKLLFDKTLQVAKESGCSGMMWQVLDWNEAAINFYKKYKSSFDAEWINCSIDF